MYNVPGREPAQLRRCKQSISEKSDGRAEVGIAADGRRDLQHLNAFRGRLWDLHSESRARQFGLIFSRLHSRGNSLLAIKYTGRSTMFVAIGSGDLHDTSFGRARLPLRITSPPVGLIGFSNVWMTQPGQESPRRARLERACVR